MAESSNCISICESICSAASRLNREKDLKVSISDGKDENISSDRRITESRYDHELVRAAGRAIL